MTPSTAGAEVCEHLARVLRRRGCPAGDEAELEARLIGLVRLLSPELEHYPITEEGETDE
jgi:hypothetical protein